MRFIKREQSDNSFVVEVVSRGQVVAVIADGHRLWAKYQAAVIADQNVTTVGYVAPAAPAAQTNEQKLMTGDLAATRLADETLDALIAAGALMLSDLSPAAQTMYTDRKTWREA